MPVSKPDYSSGASTTTNLDVGTYSLKQVTDGLSIPKYDYILIDPSAAPASGNQTITYRSGGASGLIVATVTLVYASGNLVSVTKT